MKLKNLSRSENNFVRSLKNSYVKNSNMINNVATNFDILATSECPT